MPMDANTQNLINRQLLLKQGIPMTAKIGRFGPYSPGDTARLKLRNVGVITGLHIYVSGKMTIATGAATPSELAPYNLLSKVETQDFNTTTRFSAPGHMIYALLSARNGWPWMSNTAKVVDTNQVVLPTAIVSPSSANFGFPLDIPFAYDAKSDLRGAILGQTIVGEQYLNLTFASEMVSDASTVYTAVASSGTATLSEIYVDVWQDFIQPQGNLINSLPILDLQTVYEFQGGFKSSSNLAANQVKYIEYPNVRTVLGTYIKYINNGVLTANETDVSEIDVFANGNTYLFQATPRFIRQLMRSKLAGDLPSGMYWLDHRLNPIQTAIYGQLQIAFTPAVVNSGNTEVETAFECFYALNQPLPGMGQ